MLLALKLFALLVLNLLIPVSAQAALSVDRSRLIFNEGDKSVSLTIANRNTQDPYLAQGWIEDEQEKKLSGPLMVLPPMQRVEAGSKTAVRVQALPEVSQLPKDRESVFYLNLREIPPKSDKKNSLMLAMQIRMKIFYRPAALKVDVMADAVPGTMTLTLNRQGNQYEIVNPTPYYFTFVEARQSTGTHGMSNFQPVMVEPKSKTPLAIPADELGTTPVLMFVNDYGSQRLLTFTCQHSVCKAGSVEAPKQVGHKPVTTAFRQG
ncbi:fimbria/pilus periplasmic chaperone [Enterobacter sp. Cy-643]|uniref:fimbria/pilus periplasmic chaperone n=1 Tax=Enterobacter sp. Cy-643 TaxID=2608346 RepID=UPI002570E774|nr:fimbria/pilus periplasmic chaperone [Enterobacter sp. Cy-643]